MDAPSNSDDMIDSRQVIERIEELEGEIEHLDSIQFGDQTTARGEVEAELKNLTDLASEAEVCASYWKYGETLIRDSYFKTYARELAEEAVVNQGLAWPMTCIDWDQAARELQMDYTSVDFTGVSYWIRAS